MIAFPVLSSCTTATDAPVSLPELPAVDAEQQKQYEELDKQIKEAEERRIKGALELKRKELEQRRERLRQLYDQFKAQQRGKAAAAA